MLCSLLAFLSLLAYLIIDTCAMKKEVVFFAGFPIIYLRNLGKQLVIQLMTVCTGNCMHGFQNTFMVLCCCFSPSTEANFMQCRSVSGQKCTQ